MQQFLQINTITLAVFGLSIFGIFKYFFSLIQNLLKKDKEERELISEAIIAILHNKIYKNGISYMEQGYVTPAELNDIEHLYKPYDKMGGNGTAKAIMENVKKLPIKRVQGIGDDYAK